VARLTIRRKSRLYGKVIVDGKTIARIGARSTVEIILQPGRHEILVRLGRVDSNTVQLDVVTDDEYELELGPIVPGWITLIPITIICLGALVQSRWAYAILVPVTFYAGPYLAFFAYLFRMRKRPFYLRDINSSGVSGSGCAPRCDRSWAPVSGFRLSMRSLMIAVAFLAVLLAIDVGLARWVRQVGYRAHAKYFAERAVPWRERQRTLEKDAAVFEGRGDDGLAAWARAQAAKAGARAAYYEDLNRKYTRAASERWRSVELDPPEPPFP
jgi:hypothetical protein